MKFNLIDLPITNIYKFYQYDKYHIFGEGHNLDNINDYHEVIVRYAFLIGYSHIMRKHDNNILRPEGIGLEINFD
jgi:hypothetical protein